MDIYFSTLLLNSPPKFLNLELKSIRHGIMDRAKGKRYREKHKERLNKKEREQYQQNIEKERERNRIKTKKAYEENPKKYREEARLRRKLNPEKHREAGKKYRENNPEQYKKSARIGAWKINGLICDDYDKLYQHFLDITNCDLCGILLTTDRYTTNTTRCMDHSHITGLFRNIVCKKCNSQLPFHS